MSSRDITTVDAELARQWLREHIGRGELASYLVGDSGDRFAVKRDGSTYVSPSAGMEIAPEDRPIAWVKCKGIGNLDMTWWREDWECDDLDDTEVIWDCCENGDVSDELDDLIGKLVEDIDLDELVAELVAEHESWPVE